MMNIQSFISVSHIAITLPHFSILRLLSAWETLGSHKTPSYRFRAEFRDMEKET